MILKSLVCLVILKYKLPITFLKGALLIISNKFKRLFSYKIVKVRMSHYKKNNIQLIIKNRISFRVLKIRKIIIKMDLL